MIKEIYAMRKARKDIRAKLDTSAMHNQKKSDGQAFKRRLANATMYSRGKANGPALNARLPK